MSKSTLFIIDAYNLIYRMFYAIPEMHTRDGRQVNAIFGVAKFLRQLSEENPEAHLVVANDVGKSFRADMYAEYKGTRDRMPDNLRSQIEGVLALFETAGIPILSEEGYEADDIIGSLCEQFKASSSKGKVQVQKEQDFSTSLEMTILTTNNQQPIYQCVIISSDKDLCQFVQDGCVHIYDAMKRKFMKEKDVLEKFGVPTTQVRDYLAIVGDSSDNIPGVAGFGPKKAVDLLTKYESLEGIYEHLDELTPKMQEVLRVERDNAFLSRDLATIKTDLTVDGLPETPFAPRIQSTEYIDLIKSYEFKSLIPATHQVEVKKESLVTEDINTIEKLELLQNTILASKELPLSVSIDPYNKISLAHAGTLYTLDTHKVESTSFIEILLSGDISVVGYDLKETLKKLYTLKKPLQKEVEGQGRLF